MDVDLVEARVQVGLQPGDEAVEVGAAGHRLADHRLRDEGGRLLEVRRGCGKDLRQLPAGPRSASARGRCAASRVALGPKPESRGRAGASQGGCRGARSRRRSGCRGERQGVEARLLRAPRLRDAARRGELLTAQEGAHLRHASAATHHPGGATAPGRDRHIPGRGTSGDMPAADTAARSLAHWSEEGRAGMEAFYVLARKDYRVLAEALDWGRLLRAHARPDGSLRLLDVACGSGRPPRCVPTRRLPGDLQRRLRAARPVGVLDRGGALRARPTASPRRSRRRRDSCSAAAPRSAAPSTTQ